MGQQLGQYFEKAALKGGLNAQVKFAMLTRMSRQRALDAQDSPENIKLFDESLAKL